VTAFANAVKLKEGWFDMKGVGKVLGKLPLVGRLLGGNNKVTQLISQDPRRGLNPKNALEQSKDLVKGGPEAPKMRKGGMVKKGYHKMPDGKMMKDSAHKKMAKKSTASKRADGICKKGKTKGRMC
jgi:hypothetical protein